MDREAALELLRSAHSFPGPYRLRVVVRAGLRAGVVSALQALVGERLASVDEQPSRHGAYVSLRLVIDMQTAEQVLDAYALIEEIDGVLTVM